MPLYDKEPNKQDKPEELGNDGKPDKENKGEENQIVRNVICGGFIIVILVACLSLIFKKREENRVSE
ncbi:MAG: hypothetical protein AAF335_00860 [Bacteroidota bacterium]